ncbi:tetratricopeptide repeat protein [Pseudomaricurvus alkylphenolicus]|nr:tetratricopeptide repeat protein [Pseudomaricurvus alkylphenolicus]
MKVDGNETLSAADWLKRGDLVKAIAVAKSQLRDNAEDVESLYVLAVCQRYAKRFWEALDTLEQLQAAAPEFGRLWQERGHIRIAQQQEPQALVDYRRAVQGNPALVASWSALVQLETGKAKQAAQQQLQWLKSLPPELLSVTSMLHEGKLYKAEKLCRAFLQKTPHHPEAMRLLARLGLELNILDDAEFLLQSVLEMHPDFVQARFDYVDVLKQRQKFQLAYDQALELSLRLPENPSAAVALANQALALGRYEEAISLYSKWADLTPNPSVIYLSLGHAYKTSGDQSAAINAYRRASELREGFGDAYWSLANLKTYVFNESDRVSMKSLLSRTTLSGEDRIHLCFALGKALEDSEDYQASFDYYRQGNQAKQQQSGYRHDRIQHEMVLQRQVVTEELVQLKAGLGYDAPDPIFIVGLPRAGSTLLEQILSSHPEVDGTLELPNILNLAHRLNGRRKLQDHHRYPAILEELNEERLQQYGQEYIRDTQVFRQGAPHFIDKMPNNFRHIGLIKLMLPNAKIIDARRHPMACCFSGYKQLFAQGQEFSYSLDDIGRYYRDYVQLMEHWQKVFPDQILQVQYEQLVEDFEPQVRRLLDYCGLPFDDACLSFHQNRREVRTASSEQVRQPLYRGGLDHWRHFEEYLAPLEEALGATLVNYLPASSLPDSISLSDSTAESQL